jgi:protein-S-isoprenylcysteine O-methyltransferase Ste14
VEPLDQQIRAILIAGALIVFPIAGYFRYRAHVPGEPLDRRQEGIFILFTLRPVGLVTAVAVVAWLVSPPSMAWSSVPLPAWTRWSGVALGVAAGALWIWTFRTLGPNLTDTVVTRRAHTLVTGGPYRWVRHPFYVSMTLLLLGNSLATANWAILAGGTLLMTLIVIRASTEERLLIARFGDSYRDYMARTGRFLPRFH